MSILGILVGIFILSIMLIVHELGHFLAGKALGFKIISYNIFMGPILWQRKGKDGILYTIRLLPIGASVEFAGEGAAEEGLVPEGTEDFDPQDPGVFTNRPRWARAIVVAMGPLTNFFTAFVSFALLFAFYGTTVPKVGTVLEGSIAEAEGIAVGDRILSYNGMKIKTGLDYSMAQVVEGDRSFLTIQKASGTRFEYEIPNKIESRLRLGISYNPREDKRIVVLSVDPASNGGDPVLQKGDELLKVQGRAISDPKAFQYADGAAKPVSLEVLRDGETLTLESLPQIFQDKEPLGLYLEQSHDFGEAMGQALAYPGSVVRATFTGISQIFQGKISAKEGLTGPIGIVVMVGDVVKEKISIAEKISQLLLYFGFISVAVGFTNILPIPAFDGNHLLILAIESLIRRDLPLKLKLRMNQVGIVFILGLAILVFAMDILKLFS